MKTAMSSPTATAMSSTTAAMSSQELERTFYMLFLACVVMTKTGDKNPFGLLDILDTLFDNNGKLVVSILEGVREAYEDKRKAHKDVREDHEDVREDHEGKISDTTLMVEFVYECLESLSDLSIKATSQVGMRELLEQPKPTVLPIKFEDGRELLEAVLKFANIVLQVQLI